MYNTHTNKVHIHIKYCHANTDSLNKESRFYLVVFHSSWLHVNKNNTENYKTTTGTLYFHYWEISKLSLSHKQANRLCLEQTVLNGNAGFTRVTSKNFQRYSVTLKSTLLSQQCHINWPTSPAGLYWQSWKTTVVD